MAAVTTNNVYVHSSPPKAISGTGVAIRQWVRAADVDKLEQVILDGQGARLLGLIDTTAEPKVKAFLRSVPSYMAKVDLIHDAVIRGSLRELQGLLDKRKLATGKDAVGRGLLHKAVLYNHKSVIDWLGKKYPETLQLKDNEARTALHYTSVAKDPDELFSQLIRLGAKETMDIHGRKPTYYIHHPENLDIEGPRSVSNNRNKRPRLESTPTLNKPISSTITRAQIRIWIHERDVSKLENIVWSGNGDKLLLETTNNPKVKRFLANVPHLLARVKSIHTAAINNDVETIKSLRSKTDIPEVFTAKDSHGLTALHKAAGLAHRSIVEWYLYEFPNQLLNDQDNEGRTPLHYATKDSSTYNFLLKAGASETILDGKGKTPPFYRRNQGELDGRHLRNIPDAPRIQGELTSWDRVVTSPGGILDPKRRISNGEFTEDEQNPLSPLPTLSSQGMIPGGLKKKLKVEKPSPPPPPESPNGSEGYQGDTEGKYMIAEDVPIQSQVDYDDYDDFEAPLEEEEPEDKNNNKKSAQPLAGSSSRQRSNTISRARSRTTPNHFDGREDDRTPDLTPPPPPETDPEESDQLEPAKAGAEPEKPEQGEQEEEEEEENTPDEDNQNPKGFIILSESDAEAMLQEQAAQMQALQDSHNTLQPDDEALVDYDEDTGITDEHMDETNFVDDSDNNEPPLEPQRSIDIDTENMEKLVQLVLDGRGNELLNMKSANPEVQEFITNIPAYMAKIASIHGAAASGNLRDLQTILDRKRLALAKDSNGLVPLHKAVLNGHSKVIRYLASNYNQSINSSDNNGRTALHYAATLPDSGVTYRALIAAGADPNVKDSGGNTPGIYLRNKQLLSHEQLVKENNNINNSMIPTSGSGLPAARPETWQRPPSAGNVRLAPAPEIEYVPPATPVTNPVSPKTLELLKETYRDLLSEDSIWAKIRNRLTNKNSNHGTKEYIQKYLPPQVFSLLSTRTTKYGASLLDVIKYYPQHSLVAPDPHAYTVFKELFTQTIYDNAKYEQRKSHPKLTLAGENAFPAIWSDEGKYLASVLGDALVKGLTQVSQERPDDPVEYLADFLHKYRDRGPVTSLLRTPSRPLSPAEYEEDAIAAAADAAIITSVPLRSAPSPTHLLDNLTEQTEESGTTGDELPEQSSSTPPPQSQESLLQDPPQLDQPMEEDTEEGDSTTQSQQDNQEVEQEPIAQEDPTQDESNENQVSEESPKEEEENEQGEAETGEEEQEMVPEESGNPDESGDAEADVRPPSGNEAPDEEDDLMRRLDDEVEEQNAGEDEIQVQNDLEEEIEGAGQRDDRGQSVLHFAAARPGGSQTLLTFLQNPLVNLAWRDERLKTARDVASNLNRNENVQTIDSFVIGKAVAGDYEALEKLMLDGYEPLYNIEDSNRVHIVSLVEKAGNDKVLDMLRSVSEFQENLEKLMNSIRLGDLERVKDMTQNDPRLAIAMGKRGRTPLHVAVLCEEYPIVQYIAHQFPQALRRGDNLERTALHYAMGIEKVEKMTRILVRMGAKRVVKDIRGRQPSYYFINREEIAVLQEEEKS